MDLVKVIAQAPSNIALIKYMGKADTTLNAATNGSISYTLPDLLTTVEIELTAEIQVRWAPLNSDFQLSDVGLKKFVGHWDRCHQRMAPSFNQGVIIRSGNNFPSDCGLASSASSFAALTEASYKLFATLNVLKREWTREELALLSKEGSGSSCRSFFGPWVYWQGNTVTPIESEWSGLLHSVVIVDDSRKKISSSQAHQRVLTSSLFEGRVERAEKRNQSLQKLLKKSNSWSEIYELAWAEFWDMHVLFETSSPPFYYMSPKSLIALRYLQDEWEKHGDGPIVTMDAGPNIHLLYRPQQNELQHEQSLCLQKLDLRVLESQSSLV